MKNNEKKHTMNEQNHRRKNLCEKMDISTKKHQKTFAWPFACVVWGYFQNYDMLHHLEEEQQKKTTQHLIDIPICPQERPLTLAHRRRGPPFFQSFGIGLSPTWKTISRNMPYQSLSDTVDLPSPPRCLLATALRDLETLAVGPASEEQRHVLQQLEVTDQNPVEKHQKWSVSIFFGCCLQ